MGDDELTESSDLFWALVKYTENVQESITQMDNINNRILPRLVEIPDKSAVDGDTSWTDLKGMRTRLAHQFWNIDPVILHTTVRDDLPQLISLLSTLTILPEPIDIDGGQLPPVAFWGRDLLALGLSADTFPPQAGRSLVQLWFDVQGEPHVFRIASRNQKTLLLHSSHPTIRLGQLYKREGDSWRPV